MSTIGVHGGGGSTSISEPVLISGSDDGGTTERVVLTDSSGRIIVNIATASSPLAVYQLGRQITGTLNSLGGTVDLQLDQGAGVAAFNVEDTGSFLGTIIVVGVVDGVLRPISQYYNATDNTVDTAIAMGKIYWVPAGGLETISLYVSAYTSGSADGAIGAGPGSIDIPKGTQAISAASLPLPSGAATLAEQQTQTASLSVMDDWDESDRAKVNIIAGQIGVQGGSGGVTALTQRVVLATDVALPAGDAAIGRVKITDGTDVALVTAAGEQNVIATAQPGVDIGDVTINNASGAAAVNIQDGGNSITVDGTVSVTDGLDVEGTVADDSTTPGKPVMIGGTAKETDGTDPGSVSAEDDITRVITDRNRRMCVNIAHPNMWKVFEDHTTAQTNNQLKAAPGANLSLYITDIIYSNGATAGDIRLVEDESGTPVQLTQKVYMAVNGGAVMNLITPIRMTANKSLGFTSTTVTTHTVEVHGYIAP